MNWPDPDSAAGPLGDNRLASAIDGPTTIDELKASIVRRTREGLAIYPQGGRTALDYGGSPRRPGVAIDMTGLNRVIDYPAADMTITVEAGITLGALSKVLDTEGQRLEIDAPRADRATLGGVYATNATGPRRHGCGRPRDQIIGVGFVTADGNLVKGGGRVVKNVAGYDFPKLLTGSLGTLGVIAHLTLKVRPRPEATAIVRVAYPDLVAVAHDLERVNTSSTRPVAIELRNFPTEHWTLSLGFEDNAASVAWQVDRIKAELSGAIESETQSEASVADWTSLREFAAEPHPVSIVANLRYSSVPPFLREVDPAVWKVQAHAGNGVVRAHALVDDRPRIEADIHRLRARAEDDGGSLIVARCPAEWKEGLKVWGNPRSDWAWSERIKATLDPTGVMNPGRFVGTI